MNQLILQSKVSCIRNNNEYHLHFLRIIIMNINVQINSNITFSMNIICTYLEVVTTSYKTWKANNVHVFSYIRISLLAFEIEKA